LFKIWKFGNYHTANIIIIYHTLPADFTKILTENQNEVTRLYKFAESHLEKYQTRNNNYEGFHAHNSRLRIEFRKVFADGELAGHRHAEVFLSPHYHYNDYRHNAKSFSPQNAIKIFKELFEYLGITPQVYEHYRVVVLEFGLNIKPRIETGKAIDLVAFYQRKEFATEKTENKYFKISATDKTKEWKIYDKGLQFPEIAANNLRIEIRLKKHRTITAKTGVNHIGDLLSISTYSRLFELFISDFDNIFFCDDTHYFQKLKSRILITKNRNKWNSEKNKYLKNRPHLNQLKSAIKGQLIDTFLSYGKNAISPQRTTINREKLSFQKDNPITVKGETARHHTCEVTKLDISMQRKGSKFLCFSGLRYYKECEPQTFKKLSEKYLTIGKRTADLETQLYYIAHSIRNEKTNPHHNRQRFEKRNYHPHQLQLFNI